MALVRWEPAREFTTLQSEMNRLFHAFFEGDGESARRWAPPMDLMEADDHLVLKADLPGMSEDDVKIELHDRVLTISGNRKAEHDEQRNGYYRVERSFGTFARSLTLPDGVDVEGIEASFDRGVLVVRIPKPAERQPHRISIGQNGGTVEGTSTEQ